MGMIGLGRMGASMVRRLQRGGHACVVFDADARRAESLVPVGATATDSPAALVSALDAPRVVWLMVPAAAVDPLVEELVPLLEAGDAIVDGGNSHYVDAIQRTRALEARGLHHVDVGVSGGVWGEERGYCLMIGGGAELVARLDPIFAALAPGIDAAVPTPGRQPADGAHDTAARGYLHCGGAGAGHFVKMVHNGIEYGLMAAYAEGFNILAHANAGTERRAHDAETTPLRHPEHYRYDFALEDVAEVWRRGSVIGSWLLDLVAIALTEDPELERFGGRVADSGEGRWTAQAAIESSTPAPVLTAALYQRFASRGEDALFNRLLSAMRYQFGGHVERPADE